MHLLSSSEAVFILLQCIIVVFLLIHDWIPLGPLNDVKGVLSQNTVKQNLVITGINTVPFAIGLFISLVHIGKPYPLYAKIYLVLTYALLFMGELKAWWIPYFFGTDPQRVRRYEVMFGKTHSFLPKRNGIVPNTAHTLLHICTLIVLILAIQISLRS
jgi:hypothetical protein